jgi:hypothetical protein
MKKTAVARCGFWSWLLAPLLLVGLGAVAARASPCDPAEAEPVTLHALAEDGELVLEDGVRAQLIGLENSPATRPRLVAALREVLRPGAIVLAASGGMDRWGRRAVSVFLPSAVDDSASWLQEDLLRAGQTRALPGRFTPSCWLRLIRAEAEARRQALGIWNDPEEAAIPAQETARLMARQGRRTVVTGVALSLGEGRSTIFLNFGSRRYGDFSVAIPRRRLNSFVAAAKKPSTLIGRHLLVRGVVSGTRQPRIEANSPDDIEISDPFDTRSVDRP